MSKREKIVIANGTDQADYIISIFPKTKYDLVVINSDEKIANRIANKHCIPVYVGFPYRKLTLEESNIQDASVFIALDKYDANNFVSCLMAKQLFNVKKCICTVSNPKNVDMFKKLGIDSVVCSTHLLAESIQNEANIEDVVGMLSLEQGKISIVELKVVDDDYVAGKSLREIGIPQDSTISCIYRNPNVIIPNGTTVIRGGDKLTCVTIASNVEHLQSFIKSGPAK